MKRKRLKKGSRPKPVLREPKRRKKSRDAQREQEPRSVLAAIRAIQNGTTDPTSLAPSERRACVEHLSAEGYSVPQIAEILKVSDRTIHRDRAAIREANALEQDPRLAGQMAGQLMQEVETSIQRLRRIARDKETPHATRVEAEHRAIEALGERIRLLQSLGYLPQASRKVEAQLTHNLGDVPEYEEMETELNQLEAAGVSDAAARKKLAALRKTVRRARAAERIDQTRQSLTQEIHDDDAESEA